MYEDVPATVATLQGRGRSPPANRGSRKISAPSGSFFDQVSR